MALTKFLPFTLMYISGHHFSAHISVINKEENKMNKIEKKLYEFLKMYFILVHPCVKIHLGHLLCICLSLSIVAVHLDISGCVWDRALKFF